MSAPPDDPACPFCTHNDPTVTVWADAHVQAIVSRAPINGSHVLVVPRRHLERFTDVPADVAASVWEAARRVARAIEASAAPDGIVYLTEDDLTGQGYNLVAHWKLHVIARFRGDAVRLEWGRGPDPGHDVRAGLAERLRAGFAQTG
jgi:diadenosine tetraphosphate (Ap4A) HIT family hydrolase